MDNVKPMKYTSKEDLIPIAEKVLDALKEENLPIWQVKEVLAIAARRAEWQILK